MPTPPKKKKLFQGPVGAWIQVESTYKISKIGLFKYLAAIQNFMLQIVMECDRKNKSFILYKKKKGHKINF